MRNAYCPSCGHVHKYSIKAPESCAKCGSTMSISDFTRPTTASVFQTPNVENKRTNVSDKWRRKLAKKRGEEADDDEDDDFESDVESIPSISRLNVSVDSSMDGYSNTKLGRLFGSMDKLEEAANLEAKNKSE